MFLLVLYPPPPILRLNIAYFAVAEGWLLLDIGWFVLFLYILELKSFEITWLSIKYYYVYLFLSFPSLYNRQRNILEEIKHSAKSIPSEVCYLESG